MHTPNPEIKGQRLAKGLYYDIGLQLMKLLNILLIVAAFAGCWLLYYVNRVIMRPSPLRSAGVILLFTFLYSFFGRVYDAFLISLKRISDYPYQCITESVDVQQVANLEKKVPLDWITPDGMQVTAAFEEYARPLILDEVTPVYVNGTPRHICL